MPSLIICTGVYMKEHEIRKLIDYGICCELLEQILKAQPDRLLEAQKILLKDLRLQHLLV